MKLEGCFERPLLLLFKEKREKFFSELLKLFNAEKRMEREGDLVNFLLASSLSIDSNDKAGTIYLKTI